MTIEIPSFLPWSEPKRVQTAKGARLLRKAPATDEFWTLWRTVKPDLQAAGISVTKDRTGQWEVCWWGSASAEEQQAEAARIEASRATDRADVEIPKPEGLEYLGYQRAGIAFAVGIFEGRL